MGLKLIPNRIRIGVCDRRRIRVGSKLTTPTWLSGGKPMEPRRSLPQWIGRIHGVVGHSVGRSALPKSDAIRDTSGPGNSAKPSGEPQHRSAHGTSATGQTIHLSHAERCLAIKQSLLGKGQTSYGGSAPTARRSPTSVNSPLRTNCVSDWAARQQIRPALCGR